MPLFKCTAEGQDDLCKFQTESVGMKKLKIYEGDSWMDSLL